MNKNTIARDENGQQITIPSGFAIAPDSPNKVNEGIVITDGLDTNGQSTGNEFVWIPCTVEQYEEAEDDVMDEGWICDNGYKDNGDNNYSGTAGGGKGRDWQENYTLEDNNKIKEIYKSYDITNGWITNQTEIAKASIEKYGGFYIARYEAGVPSNAPFYASDTNLSYNSINKIAIASVNGNDGGVVRGSYNDSAKIKDLKPVSKKGVQAWNYITQPNSKIVAENMYKGNGNVGSYLVDNQAWNHICKNIFKNNTEGKSITNSSSWGNYYNNNVKNYTNINGLWAQHILNGTWTVATTYKKEIVATNTGTNRIELGTGSSEEFKLYNIYDMAGNMYEWTTGHNIKNNNMFVVPRGGCFDSEGNAVPVVRANGSARITYYCANVGFRVVLYIK